jgi:AraC-like DNA-binding protein
MRMEPTPMVITANIAYHEPEAVTCGSLCFKWNMIDRDFPLHMHDYYEIELVIEGEAVQWLNGARFPIAEGSLFMLSPEDMHRFTTDMPLRLLSIKVLDDMIPADLRQLLALARGGVFAQMEGEALTAAKRVFIAIHDELAQAGPFFKPRCYSYLTLLVTGLFAVAEKAMPAETHKPIMNYLRVALDYISANYRAPISLADVSAACNVSPCYFSTIFAQYVGCNFSKYLIDFRLRKAQALLTETDMSVLDIAFESGFGSLSNFLRAFRRHFDTTPSKYRAR